ncbi:hypothetical protein C922_02524 [Plasmodium inui San Antonio 1]|uniref:Plasmodium RESA N-terminal domain-containing protein n=1 Tax=Plasmodium inui San Antonio 1 TaxID=1237626 RepID=W7A5C6_9APIC|nr:hypothetical protein C922_02524 [Plasmodium inui San Antonio 1]EUD66940.1 hypothetical protein C922_02524 [Plasmodium inui San Antonio 1]
MLSAPKALFCSFALLNLLVSNNVTLSNDLTPSSRDVSVFPRHLSELKPNSSTMHSSKKGETQYPDRSIFSVSLFTEHSDNAALLSELKRKEHSFHECSYSDRYVSKEDMAALLDGFEKLYLIEHARTLDRLSKALCDLAEKYGMSDRYKRQLWKECKQNIESELRIKKDSYKTQYNSFVMSHSKRSCAFIRFYKKYVKAWHNALIEMERKWNRNFTEGTRKYTTPLPKPRTA